MNDVIVLNGLECTAIVGVLDFERVTPQPLRCDIELHRDFSEAVATDDVHHTTNYAALLDEVQECVMTSGCFLLETLAHRVAQVVLDFDAAVTSVTVAVTKLSAPVSQRVASVGVRTTLVRD